MIEWKPIETVPYDQLVTVWHKIHQVSITGTIKKRVIELNYNDGLMEKTLTTFWPIESFTHWRKPDTQP